MIKKHCHCCGKITWHNRCSEKWIGIRESLRRFKNVLFIGLYELEHSDGVTLSYPTKDKRFKCQECGNIDREL